MINWRRALITASVCFSLPALSLADVFHCPSSDTLMLKRSDSFSLSYKWQAEMNELPEEMPSLFKGALYTIDWKYDETIKDSRTLDESDLPLKVNFQKAVYMQNNRLEYYCVYTSEDFKDIEVILRLSEQYLPDSNSLPLLVKPYGKSWSTDTGECNSSAEDCTFAVPQIAARFSSADSPVDVEGMLLMGSRLMIDLAGITHSSSTTVSPLSFHTSEEVQFKFLDLEGWQATRHTHLNLYDEQPPIDIYAYLRAYRGLTEADVCIPDSETPSKCPCSSKSLFTSINSSGHTMLDINIGFSRMHSINHIYCNLFNIPPSSDHHQPHDHEHHPHDEH